MEYIVYKIFSHAEYYRQANQNSEQFSDLYRVKYIVFLAVCTHTQNYLIPNYVLF